MSNGPDLPSLLALTRRAGEAILAVYRREFSVEYKEDESPLTEADLASHRVLVAGLSALSPTLPVLSEESTTTCSFEQRSQWPRYWLVDPLDGTKEFVKRNDEFTINIALVEAGMPVLGIVYAPALDELAWAAHGQGAWLETGAGRAALQTRASPAQPVLTISRSHADERTRAVLDTVGAHETLSVGSALKFIRLAQGRADLYPRLGPTCEWDTAAGQCLLEVAGGALLAPDGRPFRYNQRETLLNGRFLAYGDRSSDWPQRLLPLLTGS